MKHRTPTAPLMAAIIIATLGLAPATAPAQDELDYLFEPAPADEGDEADEASSPPAAEDSGGEAPPPEPAPLDTIEVGGDAQPVVRDAPRGRVLEEIIVTAQKRDQAIQDVPISMSALTGDFLVEQGVTDVREALQLVPNASVDAAGFFAAPRVRGFTFNNNNKVFEPPVGMALDGIPHTRVPYFNAALFDVKRMEVLRGPQGTSFGKNTTAGLVHVISNGPTPDYEGVLSIEQGELSRNRIEAAYGGPLTGSINFRVAGLVDKRDGYIRNTTARTIQGVRGDLKSRDRSGLRAILEWPELAGGRLELAFESMNLFDGGAALETLQSGPVWKETIRRYDPNADFTPGNWVHSQDLDDYRDVDIQRLRGHWEQPLGDWSLVALGALARMKQTLSLDTDFEPAEAINGFGSDNSPMAYAEFRMVAPTFDGLFGLGGGRSDLLFGFTASRRQILDSNFIFGINNGPFYDLVTAAGTDTGNPPDELSSGGLIGAVGVNPTGGDDSYDEFNQFFEQSADAASVYAHLKWQFTEIWGLELGGRYTAENKEGDWDTHFTTPPPNPSLQAIGTEEFVAHRERRERNFQPKISLNYQPSDALSVFAHWEKGFKGGGFNAFAFREGTDPVRDAGFEDDDLVFEEEIATNWGLDFKMTLAQGAARLNISLFRETAKDFQVLIRENPEGTIGLGTSRVVNAEEALAQGVEADILWLATDWLTVTAGIGLLDTEFISFPDGECPAGNSNRNLDGDDNPRCDQSGREFPFAPQIGGALSLRTVFPITAGLNLEAGTLIEYESDQLLDVDLEEKKRQGAYSRYKADVGIRHPGQGWTLRLVGENLTNTVTHVRYGDIFEDVVVGSQNQPRLIYAQFRQEF